MKKTRLFLAASLLAIGSLSTVTMTSCSKDDKICDAGYEGDNCDVEIRAKMIGSYTAADVNTANSADAPSYVAQISANAAVTVVNIANFSGGGSVGGFSNLVTSDIVSSADGISFTIPTQTPDNDGYSVSGSGNFNATTKKITIKYAITAPLGAGTNNYTGTWTKN